jgi:Protein of unknown function (DUF1552)
MPLNRRQLLKALGLGALATVTAAPRSAVRADVAAPPKRIVFFLTPHGLVPKSWMMPIPGGPTDQFAERPLADLAAADFSEVLRPLHPFRSRILPIEGLSHTSVLADIAGVLRAGSGDSNNHSVAVAHLLTGATALQRVGTPCTGGARSLDQELAVRTAAPGRFGSRVYGYDYLPNAAVSQFSFLGPGQAAPIVADPRTALADLLGYYTPPAMPGSDTREAKLAALRPSVLDIAAHEYELLAPKLDPAGQKKLDDHRDLVRQLEASLGVGAKASCSPSVDTSGDSMTQFMRLIKLGLSCDLTRVVTFVAPVPECPEIGYPADATIHGYAHQSIEGATSCGTTYSPVAERAMTDLAVWYASHFATLLQELDSVSEGNGTVLDHTLVVWMTELGTPTHLHHDIFTLVAGASDFFELGRYVRYPRQLANPMAGAIYPRTGPASNRLFVSLLQAMGQPDDSFGMTDARGVDGSALSLRGPLAELHRA